MKSSSTFLQLVCCMVAFLVVAGCDSGENSVPGADAPAPAGAESGLSAEDAARLEAAEAAMAVSDGADSGIDEPDK